VGCGRKECDGANGTTGWYVVCEYYPAGNVVGDNNEYFVWNVKKQVEGKDTDTVESGVTKSVGSMCAGKWSWGSAVLLAAAVVGGGMIL
jgi:hypothetical protein